MLRKIMIFALMTFFLTGCAMSSRKINAVQLGMTKPEVIRVMGEPDHVAGRGDVEVLNYRLSSGILFTDEYIVRLKNGQVDLFGQRYDFNTSY